MARREHKPQHNGHHSYGAISTFSPPPIIGKNNGNDDGNGVFLHPRLGDDDTGAASSTNPLQQNRSTILLNIFINILNWYAFAVFGYLSDILGQVFFGAFDDSDSDSSSSFLVEGFAVFGVSFFVRPLGGLIFGHMGDHTSRHLALVSSVILMGVASILIGCLPTYARVGRWSYWLLILLRLCQGLAAGGQLMTSIVFSVESYPHSRWGLMGSLVLTAANFGNFCSGASVYWLRRQYTYEELAGWGWRLVHILSGGLLLICGTCLALTHQSVGNKHAATDSTRAQNKRSNPTALAFAPGNRRALISACMVPVLGSAGFWLTFVWMAVYMYTLSPHPLHDAFGVNAGALFLGIILFFPAAGHASDVWGRRIVMATGGISFGASAPLGLYIISIGKPWWAFAAQLMMGLELSLWCAPMAAWLAESFEPEMRLTSVAVGYNIGVGIFSGIAPVSATYLVQTYGYLSAGYLFGFVSIIGLLGLLMVAPQPKHQVNAPPGDVRSLA